MHTHYSVFNFFRNRELDELYISYALRSLSTSMVSIFIPVYLLNLGYTIQSVLLYFMLAHLISGTLAIFVAKIATRIGFKHLMIASIPFLIVALLMLNTITIYGWPLWLIAIISGINMSLYWMGFHIDFSTFSDKQNRATEVGILRIIMSSFRALGPLIGGVLIAIFGFKILFLIVCVMLFMAVIPLMISKDIHAPFDFSIKDIFKRMLHINTLAYIARGIERGIYTGIWPIIIFFSIAKSYTTLGGITTATLILSLLFTFMISRAADTRRMLVYRLGSVINSILWVIRTTLKTNLHVFITDSIYGVSKTMYMIPFDANDYDKAANRNLIQHILYREISISLGFVVVFTILWFVGNINVGLYLAAAASLLLLVLRKNS